MKFSFVLKNQFQNGPKVSPKNKRTINHPKKELEVELGIPTTTMVVYIELVKEVMVPATKRYCR